MKLTIIDKYIIKKYLSTYFFMLGVIMLLSMVFDISEKLSNFIDNKAPISKIFIDYYLNFIIFYGNTFSSLIIFLSVIWFTAKMAQESEIIPLLFSGKPFVRILRPYMISATILTIISIFLNLYILPISNKIRLNFEEEYYRDRILIDNFHAELKNNKYVYYSSYNSDDEKFYDLNIEKWNDKNKPTSFIRSRFASKSDTSNLWTLEYCYVRKMNGIKENLKYYDRLDTNLQLKKDDIAQRDNRSETMTQFELYKYIKEETAKGSSRVPFYKISFYERLTLPFATYILTIIGFSVSSRKKRGGIGLNIAIGLGFVFIYIFMMKVMNVAALNVGFPPLLAVLTPNIIFLIIAVILYKLAPK
jgi:lipopolysaccharide export system permease protein